MLIDFKEVGKLQRNEQDKTYLIFDDWREVDYTRPDQTRIGRRVSSMGNCSDETQNRWEREQMSIWALEDGRERRRAGGRPAGGRVVVTDSLFDGGRCW